MATLTIGGKTVLTQSGTDEPVITSNVTGTLGSGVDISNVQFPAGHVIQKKAIMVPGVDLGGTYQSFEGFSNFDINLNRTSNTHAIYEVFGSAVSTEGASRQVNIAARRSDGVTYSGNNEVNLHTDSQGNGEYYSNSGVVRSPLALKALDTANINGSYTYRMFGKSSTLTAYWALNGGGDIFVCITEFIPTV